MNHKTGQPEQGTGIEYENSFLPMCLKSVRLVFKNCRICSFSGTKNLHETVLQFMVIAAICFGELSKDHKIPAHESLKTCQPGVMSSYLKVLRFDSTIENFAMSVQNNLIESSLVSLPIDWAKPKEGASNNNKNFMKVNV